MKLTTQQRKKLPKSKFALPKTRQYPITDALHAHLAESYAEQEYEHGKLSLAELGKIRKKASGVLSRSNSSKSASTKR